jgi:uncharacterized protein (DUF362 family)/Pyruvate/2-oxoacid:ferredoxin oxidoreductase delta subunit
MPRVSRPGSPNCAPQRAVIANGVFLGDPTSTNRASVAVQRCTSYDDCAGAVRTVLEDAGFDALRNVRVLIKPNMMKASAPEMADATHPAFVGALTQALVERECEVVVGDSSGLLGFTREVFEASGMTDAVRRAGGRVMSFDAGPFERVQVGGRVDAVVWVPRILFEVDHVLLAPKLKTHTLTGMSCCLKNLMGLLPGATKCDLHVRLPVPLLLSHGLLDIERALSAAGVHFSGAVVDAIWTQEGKGRRGGARMRKLDLLLASRDLAAADLACASLIGGQADALSTVVAARQRGMGPASLEQVDLVGDAGLLDVPPLEPAVAGLKDRARPAHVTHYWLRGRIVEPWHDASRCCAERACVEACPVRCIEVRGRRLTIGRECVRCFACHEACPHDAIRLRVPRAARRLFAKRATGVDVSKVFK